MYPSRFDSDESSQAETPPIESDSSVPGTSESVAPLTAAESPPVSPDSPRVAPVVSSAAQGTPRHIVAAMVLFAALGAAVSGGVVGAVVGTRLLAPQPIVAPTAAPSLAPLVLNRADPAPPPGIALPGSQPGQAASPGNIAGAVFSRVSPAVVQIVVSGRSASGRSDSGAGSGFVVEPRGYILTNHHVVEGARTVTVRFANGATREAQVLGTDRGNDLALLKVDLPPGVPVAPVGDSDRVGVGDVAIAIGSPFGLEQTVTQGIISAVHRTWAPGNGRARRNLLQTDAPINPGNSGGPLLNAHGEVIGVTNMIESPVRGNVGVGFAIPINTAIRLLPRLEAGVHIEPAWLGISGMTLDATIAQTQGLPVQEGVLIANVVPSSPAATAGLRGGQGSILEGPRGGDVIVALDGTPVSNMNELADRISSRQPGESVTLTIIRGGQRQDVQVTLQAWPNEVPVVPVVPVP
jgi:S1-C subfamily serine protease